MEALDRLRRRLELFEDLGTVVRTMKALAAANIRQYERAVTALTDYYRTVELGLQIVLRDQPNPPPPRSRGGSAGIIVFGSDYGLCGRFNEDLAHYVKERLAEMLVGPESTRVVAIGMRMALQLRHDGIDPEAQLLLPGAAERIGATVRRLIFQLDDWRALTAVERVYVFHNRPVRAAGHHPIGLQVLPVNLHVFRRLEAERWPSRSLPTYTMDRERLLASLLRQYIFVTLFRACAESLAAENASRLAAMQTADRNIEQRHEELLGQFRRQRQAAITTELLEVASGYEVLRARGAH